MDRLLNVACLFMVIMKVIKNFLFWFTLCNSSLIFINKAQGETQCDCHAEFIWIKNTFEKNDAGVEYILKEKGQQAYDLHTEEIMKMAKAAKNKSECISLIYKWFKFFRKGHLGIVDLKKEPEPAQVIDLDENKIRNHERLTLNERELNHLIDNESTPSPIGIWESAPYKVGIVPTDSGYSGIVLDAPGTPWNKGQVKFKLYKNGENYRATIWMRNFSARENVTVEFIGNNIIHINGMAYFVHKSKSFKDTPLVKSYINYIYSTGPYFEQISDRTTYVRIPSFDMSNKRSIDSVLRVNHEKIIQSPNLIIDLRNNGGGSDDAYSSLIPYLYTNPIRTVGLELLSTELNNSALLELSKDTLYDKRSRKEFKDTYDKLNLNLGSFVRVKEDIVSIDSMDRIFPFPQKVAVLINEYCGSTTEQFLLEAKQSAKVKLYGKTTFGSLDISNMHHANSPSGEFQLWYCRSKSFRIPEMAIDNVGLQPDHYLDPTIPQKDWVGFVLENLK